MTNQPKVSIIIPVYNIDQHLPRCLDSVINQTLKDIEIICINDGSTDNSLDILKDYEKKDQRIQIINKENEGQGVARNIGIGMAAGEYIGFVDGDDWVDPEMYEKMYINAQRNDVDIQLCTFKKIDLDGNHSPAICDYDYYIGEKIDNHSVIFNRHDIADEIFKIARFCWNKIYKKSFLKKNKILFSPKKYFEDNIFHFITFFKAEKISIIREPFYNYVVFREMKKERSLALFRVNREIKEFMKANNVEMKFFYKFDCYIIRRYASCYYRIDKLYKTKFFNLMKYEFQKINLKTNPCLDMARKIFCLTVRSTPYSLFKYTNIPVYFCLYIYSKLINKIDLTL